MLKNKESLNFLDLFAGAGGFSEGFIREQFHPVAHVEMDRAASFTLRTRAAYHWLAYSGNLELYNGYLRGKISREDFYERIPDDIYHSVINEEISCSSLNKIFSQIKQVSNDKKIDLIIGGPPCQAYSVAGRARSKDKVQGDPRNYLFVYYIKFLQKYKPKWFVFENVLGLLSAKSDDGKLYIKKIEEAFEDAGYKTTNMVLSAEEYGIPQSRKRVIIIGRKGKSSIKEFNLEGWTPQIKVNDVLGDLPAIQAGEGFPYIDKAKKCKNNYLYDAGIRNDSVPITWHQARPNTEQDLEIYRIVVEQWNKKRSRLRYDELPENLKTHKLRHSFVDRFKVVAGDLPYSHTVVAHISKDGHYYIHPDIKQNRSLTPREAARLQTFPDDYFFESSSGKQQRTPAFQQIGNAVPVLLAQKIAQSLREYW